MNPFGGKEILLSGSLGYAQEDITESINNIIKNGKSLSKMITTAS